MTLREDVRKNNQRLLDYVSNGGTLIVQYNRNIRNSTPATTRRIPPKRVAIASPSKKLRSRSSLPATQSFILRIKSRRRISTAGCRSAASTSWLPGIRKFEPLLASNDPGEASLKGGLLRARYGKGVYIYSAYAFFRQLPAGVPGAIRLFVNLLDAGHEPTSRLPTSPLML